MAFRLLLLLLLLAVIVLGGVKERRFWFSVTHALALTHSLTRDFPRIQRPLTILLVFSFSYSRPHPPLPPPPPPESGAHII